MMKRRYYLLIFLFVISLASSLILTFKPSPHICAGGCDIVQTSHYAYTLGIKNSIIGIFAFAILLITAYFETKNPSKRKRAIIHSGILIGAAIAFYFIYLQVFVLKSFCRYCLVVDTSLILSLATAISLWKK